MVLALSQHHHPKKQQEILPYRSVIGPVQAWDFGLALASLAYLLASNPSSLSFIISALAYICLSACCQSLSLSAIYTQRHR